MRIFIHSLKLIFSNIGQAFRLTLVPYLAVTVIGFFAEVYVLADIQWRWPILLLLYAAHFFVGLWAAVLWHRYILLNETADGWVPHLMWDRVGAYFGRLFLVSLILCGIALGVGVLVALVSRLGVGYAIASWIAFSFATFVASYRLMPVAVAAALGRRLSLAEAWEVTGGRTWTFLILSVATIVLLGMLVFLAAWLGGLSWIVAIAWSVGFGWFARIVLISILTTIYGHFVERRSLT